MPKMKMTIPHTLGQDEARQRVQGMISNMKEQYGDKVSDLEEEWSGDTGRFSLKAMGMNPLFAFVMAGVLVKLLGRVITWTTAEGAKTSALSWLYNTCCVSIFGNNEYASLMHALIMVAIFLAMCMILYRKKIFIKI